jgi:hypothetical protein
MSDEGRPRKFGPIENHFNSSISKIMTQKSKKTKKYDPNRTFNIVYKKSTMTKIVSPYRLQGMVVDAGP